MGWKLIIGVVSIWCFVAQDAIADALGDMDASVARGGRLYNDWMVELDERAPEEMHPAYKGTPADDVAQSWRCVSCHGWDYKGVNGQPGILSKAGAEKAEISAILRNQTHHFQDFLQDQEMQDLTNFIGQGLVDMASMIDPNTGKAKADGYAERPFFETVCAMCHGAEGQSLPGVSLGGFAVQQPQLTLHSIFNGHPGAVMPSLRAFDPEKLVRLLAYMQTLPENASLVSIVRGGRLYDNWFLETGRDVPVGIHPAYPRNLKLEIKSKQTWLCKECHGWDYQGKDGQYSEGRHFTGIKGIADKKGAPVKQIIKILKDDNHEYGRVLGDLDLLDLANFVSEGQVDMAAYIDRESKKVKGDVKAVHTYYPTLCGNCHGAKGRAIRTMGALGHVAVEEPWKSLHKILNGHPAEEMPAWRSLDSETIRGLMGYIQTLPQKKRS